MTELPMWAIELIAGLAHYDATHPVLYAQHAGNPGHVPTDCPCHLLCVVPNDVIAYARGFAAGRDSVSSVGGTTTNSEEFHRSQAEAAAFAARVTLGKTAAAEAGLTTTSGEEQAGGRHG